MAEAISLDNSLRSLKFPSQNILATFTSSHPFHLIPTSTSQKGHFNYCSSIIGNLRECWYPCLKRGSSYDVDKVPYVLASLGSEYDTFAFATMVLAMPSFPLYNELIPNLIDQEMCLPFETNTAVETAFVINTHKKNMDKGKDTRFFSSSYSGPNNNQWSNILKPYNGGNKAGNKGYSCNPPNS